MSAGSYESSGWENLGLYCLIPRKTRTGKVFIARADWERWGNGAVAMNERRVSTWYSDKEEAAFRFCIPYARLHPGCVTYSQASEVARQSTTGSAGLPDPDSPVVGALLEQQQGGEG